MAVLVSSELAFGRRRLRAAAQQRHFSEAPLFILVDKPVGASLAPDELPHHDIELIARRLYAIPSRVAVAPKRAATFAAICSRSAAWTCCSSWP